MSIIIGQGIEIGLSAMFFTIAVLPIKAAFITFYLYPTSLIGIRGGDLNMRLTHAGPKMLRSIKHPNRFSRVQTSHNIYLFTSDLS